MEPESVLEVKTHLLNAYRALLVRAKTLPSGLVEKLGCPFLVFPRDQWFECSRRLLMVGQEPLDWGFKAGLHYPWPHPRLGTLAETLEYDGSVKALAHAYETHTYELPPRGRRGPYTRAFNFFMYALNREGTGDVINTNLFRCAFYREDRPNERSPLKATREELQQILNWQRGCLLSEIEALAPTAVVFLTGPNYDNALTDEFPEAEFRPVDDRGSRKFARIGHQSLPDASFRTYHPGYLARSKERWSWLMELATEAAK